MIVFVAFLALLGWLASLYFNQPLLTPWIVGGAGIYALIQYFAAAKLATVMTSAKEIKKADNPRLWRVVENLAITNGMPMPKVYIINDPAPNAFATGRDPRHAIVAASTGLLDIMNDKELEAVMAHELGHVKNYDIRLAGVVAVLVGFVAILSDLFIRASFFRDSDDNKGNAIFLIVALVLAILSPIAASLIQLAVSRKREYLADASGALLTRYPEGLASALEKLKNDHTPPRSASNATAHLFIENPFDNKKVKNLFTGLFNTHPPLDERIKILRSM
jgi:heat shock protein HtpX